MFRLLLNYHCSLVTMVLAVVAISACAVATGPKFIKAELTDQEMGLVYAYNVTKSSLPGIEDYPILKIGGERVGPIKQQGYVVFEVRPGLRFLSIHRPILGAAGFEAESIEVNIQAGETYYIRMYGGTSYGNFIIRETVERRALGELPELRKEETSQYLY